MHSSSVTVTIITCGNFLINKNMAFILKLCISLFLYTSSFVSADFAKELLGSLLKDVMDPFANAIVSSPKITRIGSDSFRVDVLKVLSNNDTIRQVASINGKYLYQLGSEPTSTFMTMVGGPDIKLNYDISYFKSKAPMPQTKLEVIDDKVVYKGNISIITNGLKKTFRVSQFQNDIGYILAFEKSSQYFEGKMHVIDLRKISNELLRNPSRTFAAVKDTEFTIENLSDISVDQLTGSILAAGKSAQNGKDILFLLQKVDPFALSRLEYESESSDMPTRRDSQNSKVNRANLKKKLTAALDEVLEKYEDERTDFGRNCEDTTEALEDLRNKNAVLQLRLQKLVESVGNSRSQLFGNLGK